VIVFRANASPTTGVGHLARSHRLGTVLARRGYACHFMVDRPDSFLKDYLQPFECTGLYEHNERFADEKIDAQRFLARVQGKAVEAVIVDDYRLSEVWEKQGAGKAPVVVLDDRDAVSHACSILVDGKWTGHTTHQRYLKKVPAACTRLLGPQYLLLDEGLLGSGVASGKAPGGGSAMNLMVSLGGGGDLAVAVGLIEQVLQQAPVGLDLQIRPVVGYFAANKEKLHELAKRDARVKPIVHERSLLEHMKGTTLYIGTAGGALYEILALKIPAITFSISENQYNELADLGDLGHYFHLNNINRESFAKLAALVWLMIVNIDRIRALYGQARVVEVDGKGLERVACAIIRLIEGKSAMDVYPDISVPRTADTKGYSLEHAGDEHINRYLDARNLELNLQNMTETQKVPRLDHYLWWLKSKRKSYVLKKDGEPLLYIWHQPRTFDGTTVLVGGWFVCSELCGAVDALYALNKQLMLTDEDYPGLPWVAVIKKTNRYVQALNKRLGFDVMSNDNRLYEIVRRCFPKSAPEEFFYYFRSRSELVVSTL